MLGTLYMGALNVISQESDETVYRTVTDLARTALPMYASTIHLASYRCAKTRQWQDCSVQSSTEAYLYGELTNAMDEPGR